MSRFNIPTTEIVKECVNILYKIGKKEFTELDVITIAKWKYPTINESTIRVTVQGFTDNAEGGSPNARKQESIFHRISEGLYTLI